MNLIQLFYSNFPRSVGNSDVCFEVMSEVRQGCVMSALLFNLAVDLVMHRITEEQVKGIPWTLLSTTEELDCADDIALLSHTSQHIQEKTNRSNVFG